MENDKELEQQEAAEDTAKEQVSEQSGDVSEQAAQEEETAAEQETQPEPSEEEKLKKELEESKDKYLRLMAEYDNFRKRSAKERLELSATVKGNTIGEILPVFDNFERALAAETEDTNYKAEAVR